MTRSCSWVLAYGSLPVGRVRDPVEEPLHGVGEVGAVLDGVIVVDVEALETVFWGNAEKPRTIKVRGFPQKEFGGVLLSHRVPPAVPSALKGLASGFGM
ncbi:LPxTG domain-containing protein [Streptomyces laurentii]|uniref:LPxTG domain-containing protein n=1 Tax=Streptomyces laurentii TaxID=39478 RepID=A0A160P1G0_STRLU|nr:LPxTG domain-containing protein [Streptomyces laurentii]